MDHVRVGLDGHERLDLDGAVLAHAAEVVAAEVDEHHVLGALLLVGQQLGGDRACPRRRRRRAGGCRRSGASRRARPETVTQRLGRGADDLEVLEVEEVHVRRRVDGAQPAVDRERLDRRSAPTSAGEGTTWKASPACTYSTMRATIASNASRGMLGSNVRLAGARRCGSGRGSGPASRSRTSAIALAGARLAAGLVDVGVGEDRDRVLEVVEGDAARRRASAPCRAGRARRGWARASGSTARTQS